MTEYIITEEQVNEIAKSLPMFYVPTWLYKWTYKQKVCDGAYEIGRCKVGVKLPKIVRCRDCKYIDTWEFAEDKIRYICEHFDYIDIAPEGFCKWGERK